MVEDTRKTGLSSTPRDGSRRYLPAFKTGSLNQRLPLVIASGAVRRSLAANRAVRARDF